MVWRSHKFPYQGDVNTLLVMPFSLGCTEPMEFPLILGIWSMNVFSSLVGVLCGCTGPRSSHWFWSCVYEFRRLSCESFVLLVSFYLIQIDMSFWTDPFPYEGNSSLDAMLYMGHFWRWSTHCIYLCCEISYTAWNRYIHTDISGCIKKSLW